MSPKLVRGEVDPPLEAGDWPRWVPYASCFIVLITVGLASAQRLGGSGRSVAAAVALGLAVLPFALDLVDYSTGAEISLPLWLFPVPVFLGEIYLVLHPVSADVAPFVLVFMSAEMISRTSDRRWIGAATVLASCVVVILPDLSGLTNGYSVWLLAILFASGGGLMVQMLTERTAQLRRAQDDLADKAAAGERSRIAREVHDVIAHSMSVTMLHITAARMALERDKQEDALEALREAERQGRNSMNDIRRTVGLLGPDGDVAAAPMPGATDLPQLVGDFRNAGIDVTLEMSGEVTTLPAATGLTIYRITQESLTNVAKHAPGAKASVNLSIDDESLELVIRNASSNGEFVAPEGSGLGIRGMIERASVLDGTLLAGPCPDGWSVVLTAPRPRG